MRDPWPDGPDGHRQHALALADEVEERAAAIRNSWPTSEGRRRRRVSPKSPGQAANVTFVRRMLQMRELRLPEAYDGPRPDNLTPFKLPLDAPVKRPKVKLAPLPAPAIRPIGEVIAEHIARILGGKAGAV
jgi:hypothetical protein